MFKKNEAEKKKQNRRIEKNVSKKSLKENKKKIEQK